MATEATGVFDAEVDTLRDDDGERLWDGAGACDTDRVALEPGALLGTGEDAGGRDVHGTGPPQPPCGCART